MSKILDEVLRANDRYADDFGAKGQLALPPARGFAILTCMDARIDPAKLAGLAEGDAHVIRNAGGRATSRCRAATSPAWSWPWTSSRTPTARWRGCSRTPTTTSPAST